MLLGYGKEAEGLPGTESAGVDFHLEIPTEARPSPAHPSERDPFLIVKTRFNSLTERFGAPEEGPSVDTDQSVRGPRRGLREHDTAQRSQGSRGGSPENLRSGRPTSSHRTHGPHPRSSSAYPGCTAGRRLPPQALARVGEVSLTGLWASGWPGRAHAPATQPARARRGPGAPARLPLFSFLPDSPRTTIYLFLTQRTSSAREGKTVEQSYKMRKANIDFLLSPKPGSCQIRSCSPWKGGRVSPGRLRVCARV